MKAVAKLTTLVSICIGLSSALLTISSVKAARQVESQRECATCHIMWLNEFKQNTETLIPYEPLPVTSSGKQDVASTERMCFSCHDGFVLDSRFMWENDGYSHPVGVEPSKNVVFPTPNDKNIFPLNNDGKVYCGTCHTAHSVDWKAKDAPIFMRSKNIDSSLCSSCHVSKDRNNKTGNHPVLKKLKHTPQDILNAGGKLGSNNQVICESCHIPHGGKEDKLLVQPLDESQLCQSCHEDKSSILSSKHDMTLLSDQEKKVLGNKYTSKGPCGACHVAHNASNGSLFAHWAKPGIDANSAKCLTCHTEGHVANDKLTGNHSHPVNVSVNDLGIDAKGKVWKTDDESNNNLKALPLFNQFGEPAFANGKVACATCHDPHKWSVKETNKKTSAKKLVGNGDSSFLRIPQENQSKLCLNCHVDKESITETTHNVKPESSDVKKGDAGICKNCHLVHNAKGAGLRKPDLGKHKSAQAGKTTSYFESWCLDCHKEDGVAEKKALKGHNHPVSVKPNISDAKTGVLPLFTTEGVRDHEGLVDCASCHNPHQWSPEKSKNKNTKSKEGDPGNSFLRLTANQDSVLCVTCHQSNALVFGTDHDMRVTAPKATTASGYTVKQSGVCGQCHAVHNNLPESGLWSLTPGEGSDNKEKQCRSCHQVNGVADAKVPLAFNHPSDVMVWAGENRVLNTKKEPPFTPVFDEVGHNPHAGIISCPTCHNPHQWDSTKNTKGNGKNLEGNVFNSFLRNKNTQNIICADCHGKDSLFRYKYFHHPKSREKHPLYH
ncbi:MAG: hypothetical protein OEY19_03005 [Gammaproteobacteria bacterium]|nr:hypothetical protein [Gammaproteobacteria bacterium]MDH5630165.1 hypothetical protein [Gammaproteobacteria bacterium]